MRRQSSRYGTASRPRIGENADSRVACQDAPAVQEEGGRVVEARIGLTVADREPPPWEHRRAPAGAPNVVVVVLDDLGFGQLGCYGAGIDTPAIDRIAAEGLRYNRFHVTAMCSPTRASLLTGQNHHAVGMGFLADMPTSFPGYTARIRRTAATLPHVLRDAGWNTMAVGKWHLVPAGERSAAGPFDRWPLGLGFERYYGFLRGDTNHWAPHLVRDNQPVEPPADPESGYHLSEDLADTAIRMVTDQHHAAPGKPFFLYFSLGAMHAPHHVERAWSDAYRGRFDRGWDEVRDAVFARQVDLGVVPDRTTLTERPPWVTAWADLDADSRRAFARMHEVYAGFLTHTDAQIGRLMVALERLGVLDDTVVVLLSDNGASAEGGPLGTFNEMRFTHRLPERVEDHLAHLDDWGGRDGFPHYAWGWAWAGNCPFRLWKRYSWLGGTRVPLVVRWPRAVTDPGVVRAQLCHVVDLAPTLLDACGVEVPVEVDGVAQRPMDGASMLATLGDAGAPAPRSTQYFELLGSRSIIHDGWRATTDHVSSGVVDEETLLVGSRDFADDHWGLFRLEDDFAEAHDLSADHPEVVRDLAAVWLAEAEGNDVLPMADGLIGRLAGYIGPAHPPAGRVVLHPGAGPVEDDALPMLVGGGAVRADVEVPAGGGEGVLCAIGDRTSGLSLHVVGGRLACALSIGGDLLRVVADAPLEPGRRVLSCVLVPASPGTRVELRDGDTPVGIGRAEHGIPFVWQHGGAALRLGHDAGLPVCDDYRPPAPWTGVLHQVVVEAGVEDQLGAAAARAALSAE
jgi:arylsulfatase A-like enzyme